MTARTRAGYGYPGCRYLGLSDAEVLDLQSCPEPNTGCVLWTGGLSRKGYGIAPRRKGAVNSLAHAHRWAWSTLRGPIPSGLHVLHSCDTRACVNVAHLRLGTNAENVADRTARTPHYWLKGERRPNAKLTWERVRVIRERRSSGSSLASLAREFGVSVTCVMNAARGTTWLIK